MTLEHANWCALVLKPSATMSVWTHKQTPRIAEHVERLVSRVKFVARGLAL